jgi:hypothetical protein
VRSGWRRWCPGFERLVGTIPQEKKVKQIGSLRRLESRIDEVLRVNSTIEGISEPEFGYIEVSAILLGLKHIRG